MIYHLLHAPEAALRGDRGDRSGRARVVPARDPQALLRRADPRGAARARGPRRPVARRRAPGAADGRGHTLDKNPMRDLRVRQAISKAIDRKALVEVACLSRGLPAGQIVPEGFGGFNPDLEVARSPGGGQGAARRGRLSRGFGLTIGCTNDRYVNDAQVCQAVAQMLSRIGIATKVQTTPGSIFFRFGQIGQEPAAADPLRFLQWVDTRDADHVLSLVLHSNDPKRDFGQSNRGRICGTRASTGSSRTPPSPSPQTASRNCRPRHGRRHAPGRGRAPLQPDDHRRRAQGASASRRAWTSNWWRRPPPPRGISRPLRSHRDWLRFTCPPRQMWGVARRSGRFGPEEGN